MKNSISRFEWLQDYLNIDEDIRYLKWKIRKMEAEERRWESGDLSKIHLEKNSSGAHVMDHHEEYTTRLKTLEEEQTQLLNLIDSFKGYENDILKLRYIDGMCLEDIAEELGYSYETIRAKHAELHRRLDYLDEWERNRIRFENRYDSGIEGI